MIPALADLIYTSILFGSIIMFGALGEIITEKSGHLNLGIPGIIYLGGFGGWMGGFVFEKYIFAFSGAGPLLVLVSLLFAVIFAAIGGLLYAFFTVT